MHGISRKIKTCSIANKEFDANPSIGYDYAYVKVNQRHARRTNRTRQQLNWV